MQDFTGLCIAGLARMSREVDDSDEETRPGYRTGRDIAGREVQTEDCQGYTERRGGTYQYTYEEPDTSAFKQRRIRQADGSFIYRVVRPVFDKMLEDLRRGRMDDGRRLDGAIVYDIDRLTRDPRHLEDCIEVVVHYGRPIIDVTGSLDLLTDNGRTMARVIVATANKQSLDTSRRVTRKHAKMQQEGIPAGGSRPFGWNDDKRTLRADEAELVRKAVERILEGAPPVAIAAEWIKDGVRTSRGNLWRKQTVVGMLRNPRLCGLRGHVVREVDPQTNRESQFYEVVLNAKTGEPVTGLWEPIVTRDQWDALMAIMGSRKQASRAKNTRKYLYSGVLRCGVEGCGARMVGGPRRLGDVVEHRYFCPCKSQGGCGGVAITGELTDKFLTEAVLAKLELEAQRRDAQEPAQPWPKAQELADVREQIAEWTQAWRNKQVKGARYFPMLADLEADETELDKQRAAWQERHAFATPAPAAIRAQWPGKTLAERRAYAQRVLVAVIVKPAGGKRRFNPDRLVPMWVDEAA